MCSCFVLCSYLKYREDVSKTNTGGLTGVRHKPKVTEAFELADFPQRCPVRLFLFYNSVCPRDRPDGALYLRPLKNYTADKWYACAPVGVNLLGSVVSRLCKRAGFAGFFSNHSLRATAATRLFHADVDEQLIMRKTGHRSTAVRAYKRVNDQQLELLSDVVASKTKCPKVENMIDVSGAAVGEEPTERCSEVVERKDSSCEPMSDSGMSGCIGCSGRACQGGKRAVSIIINLR